MSCLLQPLLTIMYIGIYYHMLDLHGPGKTSLVGTLIININFRLIDASYEVITQLPN